MKKKKAVLVGIENPIRIKSKKYVIKILYKRARKNPFLSNKTYDEYLDYIKEQIRNLEGIDVQFDNEEELYNALKSIGWLKEINVLVASFIFANYGIA